MQFDNSYQEERNRAWNEYVASRLAEMKRAWTKRQRELQDALASSNPTKRIADPTTRSATLPAASGVSSSPAQDRSVLHVRSSSG